MKIPRFYAYILRCADGTLYAGSTNDMARRLQAHNASRAGAKYTRSRRPVELVYIEEFRMMKLARAREAQFKRLSRAEKLKIICNLATQKRTYTRKAVEPDRYA